MTELREYFTPIQAADFLGYSPASLDMWRSQGRGPAYVKDARIRYRRDDLKRWADVGGASRRELESGLECHQQQRARTKRARGRAGAATKARRLAAEPFCRDCRSRGVERRSEQVDHIIRLDQGGSDDDENTRCLCKPCHAARTRDQLIEAKANGRALDGGL